METIDVRGLSCPSPVLEVKQAMDRGVKSLKVLADCGTATENVTRFARNANYSVDVKTLDDGTTEFTLQAQ
ncbi:MAG: SirA family protein [Campylobacteraceae bacterium]|nr:SirA family protein [Campylobacteraceae bacterium]